MANVAHIPRSELAAPRGPQSESAEYSSDSVSCSPASFRRLMSSAVSCPVRIRARAVTRSSQAPERQQMPTRIWSSAGLEVSVTSVIGVLSTRLRSRGGGRRVPQPPQIGGEGQLDLLRGHDLQQAVFGQRVC